MSASEPRRRCVALPGVVEVEDDALALAQHAEDRAVERVGGEVEVGERRCRTTTAVAGGRVVALDDALHGA